MPPSPYPSVSRSPATSLLRQPGGLEGVVAVGVDLGARDRAGFEVEDRSSLLFDGSPARLACTTLPPEENHLVTGIDQPIGFEPVIVEVLGKPQNGRHDTFSAVIGTHFGRPVKPDHVLGVVGEGSISFALLGRFEAGTDNLDVLLRHRPRSISLRTNG